VIVVGLWRKKGSNNHKHHNNLVHRMIKTTFVVMILYLGLLFVGKIAFGVILQAPMTQIEPLEQFAFNYNAHTFEIDEGEKYRIGIISLKGIELDTTIPKVINEAGVENEEVQEYLTAYRKALHINWFNNPVFRFYKENGDVFANVRYAKSYLDSPHMPGPTRGMNVTIDNGMLVRHGRNWLT